MKNLVKIICGLSVFALATAACNKEIESDIPEVPAVAKHTVKVLANYDASTKTEMLSSGVQTKWTVEDITGMHFFENGIAPDPSDLAVSLNTEETELTIEAEFASTSATTFVYTSILATNLDSEKNASLDNEQFILDGTFDPLADILVAKPEEFDVNQNLVEFTMQYRRVVAINKMKVKGLAEGDVIQSVTISSNKPILGSYSMTNDAWTNSGNSLELTKYDDITVPASGEVSLWFITAPVQDATLSIYVVTDNHQYEKDFTKTISFAANTVTSFATTVAASEVEVKTGTNDFIRVESTIDLEEGEYILVTEGAAKIFTGFSSTATVYGLGEDITIDATDHKVLNTNVDSDYILSLAEGQTTGTWVIKQGTDFFNWSTGNSLTFVSSESDNSRWTIDITSGNATIANVNDSNRIIWWNVGSPRFACYTGKTNGSQYYYVQLYKKDEGGATQSALAKPIVTLERNATLNGIIVSWVDVNKAGNYTVTCTGQSNQTIVQGVQTAEFPNLDPGTYTVTVTANPANADRNTPTTSDEESLEIFNYQLTAPSVSFSGNTTTSIVATWNKQDLDDDKAASYSYQILDGETVVVAEKTVTTGGFTETDLTPNHNYTVKFKVNGKAPYVGTEYAELATKTLKPALTSIAEIKAELAQNVTTYEANLTNAVITGKWTNGAYIQDATAGIYIYGSSVVSSLAVGDSYSGPVSGTMQTYNGQPQLSSFTLGTTATKTTGAVLPLEEVSMATLLSNMASYDGKRVKIVKGKTAAVLNKASGSTVNLTYGASTIQLILRAALDANIAADTYLDVIGFPYINNTTSRIAVTDVENGIVESSITWQVKSIDIANAPDKVVYTVGDFFDPTGLIISTEWEDAADPNIYRNGSNVAYAGNETDFSFDPALDEALATTNTSVEITYCEQSASQNISVYDAGDLPTYDTKTIDFESELSTYTDWTFSNVGTDNASIDAHAGSKYGANINTSGNGVRQASITSTGTIDKPIEVKFYISRTSTNNADTYWTVEVSSDNSSWTQVESISSKGMSKGSWEEHTVSLSDYTDVYVRIYYNKSNVNSTVIRTIDDISLKYQTN